MAESIDFSKIKFEYIQSNHFKQEHDCYENKQKKGYEVLSDGFVYVKKKSNKDSNYWKCKHPKCKASLTINFNNEIVGVSHVSHSIVEKNDHFHQYKIFSLHYKRT